MFFLHPPLFIWIQSSAFLFLWSVGGGCSLVWWAFLTSQNQRFNLINPGWKLQKPVYNPIQSFPITLN